MYEDSPVAWGILLFLTILWGINKLRELDAYDKAKEIEREKARKELEAMFH